MKDNRWNYLSSDTPCICGFVLYKPIAYSNTSKLGLYSDNRFPGRCILALRQEEVKPSDHIEYIEQLDDTLSLRFLKDIKSACLAIKQATNADRVNIAILGNREHHLHAHLIPRFGVNEKYPDCSPWNDPRGKQPLNDNVADRIMNDIFMRLG